MASVFWLRVPRYQMSACTIAIIFNYRFVFFFSTTLMRNANDCTTTYLMIDKATTMSVPVGSNTIEKLGLETKWIVGTEQSVANVQTRIVFPEGFWWELFRRVCIPTYLRNSLPPYLALKSNVGTLQPITYLSLHLMFALGVMVNFITWDELTRKLPR